MTVSLSGLPKNVTAANAVLKAGVSKFRIDVKLPAGFKPAELKGLALTASEIGRAHV